MNTNQTQNYARISFVQSRDFSWTKKTILIVDVHAESRDSRSKIMRTLGVVVHSVASAETAMSRFDLRPYDLVLIDLGSNIKGAEDLAEALRAKKPGVVIGFLIGSPLFVARSFTGTQPILAA
jgi:CheY-like chemotaxis protein